MEYRDIPFTSVDNGGPVSGERLAEIREQAEYCSITVEAEELLWLLGQADEVDRLRAEAAQLESLHQGALAAMWETVLAADIETAALRVQVGQVQSQLGSWDLDDEQIERLASDSNAVRRAEQWLKLTSYRACAQSLKPILAVHRCPKCGHEVDAEETEDFIGHIRRHDDDTPALDQSGEGQANADR